MNENATGKELNEWVLEHDLLMEMSFEQAGVIASTIGQDGENIHIEGENIYKISGSNDKADVQEMTLDDVIDLVAEINYEQLLYTRQNCRRGISDVNEYCKELKHLMKLEHEHELLDKAFTQTIYAKEIMNNINHSREHPLLAPRAKSR